VQKRQRRLSDVDDVVLSLYAKGLTTGEISTHFAEIYGASVSKETISRIADKVVTEMNEWASRPLDTVYVAIFIDAVVVKVRDGQVANRPIYAAIGVTVDRHKDVLGLWAGTGGEATESYRPRPSPTSHAIVGFRFSGRLTQGPAVKVTDRRHPLRLDMLTSTRSAYVQVRSLSLRCGASTIHATPVRSDPRALNLTRSYRLCRS
jgi:hypothetical protein